MLASRLLFLVISSTMSMSRMLKSFTGSIASSPSGFSSVKRSNSCSACTAVRHGGSLLGGPKQFTGPVITAIIIKIIAIVVVIVVVTINSIAVVVVVILIIIVVMITVIVVVAVVVIIIIVIVVVVAALTVSSPPVSPLPLPLCRHLCPRQSPLPPLPPEPRHAPLADVVQDLVGIDLHGAGGYLADLQPRYPGDPVAAPALGQEEALPSEGLKQWAVAGQLGSGPALLGLGSLGT